MPSGVFRDSAEQYGMIRTFDAATGRENWHFDAPPPRDYAPLKVLACEGYVLVTNTAPTVLDTHVLDAKTGKELYPPIGTFDLYGCHGTTVYAPSGSYDLPTGRRIAGNAEWLKGSLVHNGIAWKRRLNSVGTAEAFLLGTTYDGDCQGKRDWTNMPPNSSLEGFDLLTGKSLYHTQEFKYTRFTDPVEHKGVLFHTSIAMMKEGKSGVLAYRLQ